MSLFAKLSKSLSFFSIILFLFFSLSFSSPKISHAAIPFIDTFITDSITAATQTALQGWLRSFIRQIPVELLSWLLGDITVIKLGTAYENIATKNYYALSQPQNLEFGGILALTTNTLSNLYNPPASGIQYLAQLKNNFLGTKPVYAQNGIGFQGLAPLLTIWQSFRNFVYILFSFLFVIVSIMIILRVKISSQAVISLQTALPNIITTLILVTFSYAIAGLLIDLMYVIQGIIVLAIDPTLVGSSNPLMAFLKQIPIVQNWIPNLSVAVNPNILTTFAMLTIPSFAASLVVGIVSNVIIVPLALFLALPTGGLSLAAATLVPGFIAVLALLILTIIVIWNLISFTFGLFKVYITIIFKIILAPIEIAMGALPGSKLNFSSWIMDLIANLAVFPFSFLFLFLSNLIIWKIVGAGASSTFETFMTSLKQPTGNLGMWVPGMLGGNLPFSGIITGNIAVAAIGFSTITLLPKLPEMIPQFIFKISPSPLGNAIGQGMSSVKEATNFGTNTFNKITGFQKQYNQTFGGSATQGTPTNPPPVQKNYKDYMYGPPLSNPSPITKPQTQGTPTNPPPVQRNYNGMYGSPPSNPSPITKPQTK